LVFHQRDVSKQDFPCCIKRISIQSFLSHYVLKSVRPTFHRNGHGNVFVANAFISAFKTQTMHIRSFNTQQHCNVSLKTLYPGGLRNPGLLVPEADAASTAPRPQGIV
jgi:hypothetical protein